MVTKVHKVFKVQLGLPQLVHKVLKVQQVTKVGRDPKVLPVAGAIPPQALKVTKAQQAVKEILVAKDWVLALRV